MINAIAACDINYGIGKNNGLPWPRNNEDMKWFKDNTDGGVVVMGRKTWESIGCRPLKNRVNIVITRSRIFGDYDEIYYGEMQKVLQNIEMNHKGKTIWIIGGSDVYRQALPFCNNLYLTQFKQAYDCDSHLDPKWIEQYKNNINEIDTADCVFKIMRKE